jgi:catechol 2,3-dioxygenase-like lactoylglutathione lyase family enzyme
VPDTTFNHVSIHANSLEDSVAFYTDVFGMERIPSVVTDLRKLADDVPQTDNAARALFPAG